MSNLQDSDQCCPEFDVARWDGQMHNWDKKPFIKDYVRQIFHIPLNFGSVVTRMCEKMDAAQAAPADEDYLILAYDPSAWKSEIYISVTKDVPNAEMAWLSGTFFSKVFDGPYSSVPKWISATEKILAEKGLKSQKYYSHYAYCPKCAKKYNHNYCVAFAQVG